MITFEIIPLFATAVNLLLAGFICTRDLRLRSSQVFLVWTVALAVWNLGAFYLFVVADRHAAILWARTTVLGVLWLPATFFHITLLITETRIRRSIVIAAYTATVVLSVLAYSPWLVRDVRMLDYGTWFSIAGPLFYVYAYVLFPVLVIPAFVLLVRRYRKAAPEERRKLGPLILSDALLAIFGVHDMSPLHGTDHYPGTHISIYPWGSLAACVYGLIVGHALLHEQLLDTRISLGRQAATILRLLFLVAAAYVLLAVFAVLVPQSFTLAGFAAALVAIAAAALLTAHFFPRLLGAKSERLEMRILGDRFEYQDQVRRFTRLIPSYTQLGRLLTDTQDVLLRTMRLSSFELLVLDPATHEIKNVVSAPPEEAGDFDPEPLVELFSAEPERDYLDCRNEGPSFWPGMRQAAIASLGRRRPDLIYPLRTTSRTTIGLLLCGNKSAGRLPVTTHDMELLLDTCQQLGYALERMHLAQQAAVADRLDTLTWMSRGLAHDLPNAVMPITTFLEIVKPGIGPDDDRYPLLQLAARNTANILAYAHEAMFFVHDFQLRYAPIDVEELLANVIVNTSSRADRRGVKVQYDVAAGRSFEGDPILLQRLLGNLVSNACDASPEGGLVMIRFAPLADSRTRVGWVRFDVIDHGVGIAPPDLERIFDAYYSTKQVGDGTRGFGLGLTIAQKIVLLHQGNISVKSEVGRGTTFHVDLPPRNPAAT